MLLGDNRALSPNVEALSSMISQVPTVTPVATIPPNIRAISTTTTQPSFMMANGNVLQQSPSTQPSSSAPTTVPPHSTNSKIDDILASLNELQKNVPELVGSDSNSVDEGIRNLLKQFQSSDQPSSADVVQVMGSESDQTTSIAGQEGTQDPALGDTADDSRSQGEDLLVIQEDWRGDC